MNSDAYSQTIEHEQSKGFLPRPLDSGVRQSLMLLEEGLQPLEAACAMIDGEALDTILEYRYAYPDMFTEAVIADTIDSGNMGRYPAYWIHHRERDRIRMNDHRVDEESPFSLWADLPFTITVRELPRYPLLSFRSSGAYVAFMLLLREGRHVEALSCLNSSSRVADGRERPLFDSLFQKALSASEFELVRFLLYRALFAAYSSTERGAALRNTWGDVLVSKIQFPPALAAHADKNWYGELLMMVRRGMKPKEA